MHIALLAPMAPEQNGIADYAGHLRTALEGAGVRVSTPLAGIGNDPQAAVRRVMEADWRGVQLVHGELGGGRLAEFHALRALAERYPGLPLTATVHDPERLVWRRQRLPWPLSLASGMRSPLPQIATVLADPLCLSEERHLAQRLSRIITLTAAGGQALRRRMKLPANRMAVVPHGNLPIAPAPLPPPMPVRLLYFGFIYRGKGIEDLLDALAALFAGQPTARSRVRLTLAGGSEPETAFSPSGNYLDTLRGRVRQLALDDVVEWRLDLPAEQIPALIQAHHVMVLPYRESTRLKLLGQMRGTSGALSWAAACGRGVITSDARSFAEEVSQGNGVIYPQGDVAALARQLARVVAEPQLATEWAAHAQAIGQAREWTRTAQRFIEVFHQACGGQRDVATT